MAAVTDATQVFVNEPVQIEELLDQFVLCRTLGHSWDENPNPEWNVEVWALSFGAAALRCVRCNTHRYDYLDAEFRVFTRRYAYPPRYKTIPGMGTRPNLRAELVRRGLLIRRFTTPQQRRGPGRPRKDANG